MSGKFRRAWAAAAGVMLGGTGILGAGAIGQAWSAGAAVTARTPAVAGAQLWASRYDRSGLDSARSVAVAEGGRKVFVTGTSGRAAATAAYNSATGSRLWAKRYEAPGGHRANGEAAAASRDGGTVFVTGFGAGAGSRDDYVTIAYNAVTGAQRWLARYDGTASGGDEAFALAVSPDGKAVFVTGQSDGSGSGADFGTVAYSTATGAQLWEARYDGPGNSLDSARSLAIGPGGHRVFVTGVSTGANSVADYATVGYDAATGRLLWAKHSPGPGLAPASSVAVGPAGARVYVTETSGITAATLAYDASTGARLWARRYPGQDNRGAFAAKVAASPDGTTVYVAATSGQVVSDDYATIAYNSRTGARRWLRLYNGPGNSTDDATALAVSPNGTVYVTGASSGGSATGPDYTTVAYSPGGARLWVSRYNGQANREDDPADITVSSAGRKVIVTGQSLGTKTPGHYGGFDYATVAYSG